jgi:hypothetical protein
LLEQEETWREQGSTQRRTQTIVKDHIFPKIKFADLSFSNDPQSLCRQMEMLASVTDVDIEAWWNLTRKVVFESIKCLRNNSISTLGDAPVEGNFVVMSLCCFLRLHILFSNTHFPSPPQQKIY